MSKEKLLAKFNAVMRNTLMETLNMRYVDIDAGKGMLKISMPVNSRVHQPMGLLHGGATAAVAESVGSAASCLFANPKEYLILGIELSCNHIKSKKEGMIYGTATIIHKGSSIHLWEICITDEENNLISYCKLTNMIAKKDK